MGDRRKPWWLLRHSRPFRVGFAKGAFLGCLLSEVVSSCLTVLAGYRNLAPLCLVFFAGVIVWYILWKREERELAHDEMWEAKEAAYLRYIRKQMDEGARDEPFD